MYAPRRVRSVFLALCLAVAPATYLAAPATAAADVTPHTSGRFSTRLTNGGPGLEALSVLGDTADGQRVAMPLASVASIRRAGGEILVEQDDLLDGITSHRFVKLRYTVAGHENAVSQTAEDGTSMLTGANDWNPDGTMNLVSLRETYEHLDPRMHLTFGAFTGGSDPDALTAQLDEQVIDQEGAVDAAVSAVMRSRAKLHRKGRPRASFLFMGPTGVGKTEMAKALAERFGMGYVRLDMSEYSEKHNVSRMIGPPPGYHNHEDGGQLTNAVRDNPKTLVHLDEIEKGHQNAHDLLLQVLDDGRLTDGKGQTISFEDAIIVMTTNAGGQLWAHRSGPGAAVKMGFGAPSASDFDHDDDDDSPEISDLEARRALIDSHAFRPELVNRPDEVIVFNHLTKNGIRRMVRLRLRELHQRLAEAGHGVTLQVSPEAEEFLAQAGYTRDLGGRPLNRAIQTHLEDNLAHAIVRGELTEGDTAHAIVHEGRIALRSARTGQLLRMRGNRRQNRTRTPTLPVHPTASHGH